ncbi:melanopsin-like [Actinia tenebrosa]|uniref:Melanopsin-like n=1 Tax=Actinia tenebrosa TaxID=6105 RepID=A0A6P8IVA6_ACTTE|nr:melanopsin-like [Actinia tenebrosa]
MPFPLHFYHWISAWMGLISVTSFLLNGCVIITFLTNRALLTSSNYLLLSMAFSDWLRSVFVAPIAAYANAKHWWTLHPSVCQYFAFSSTVLGLTSMIHLVALSVEKCYTIKMPSTQLISERKIIAVIIGLWLFSLLWSLFPLLGWSSFGPEPGYSGCSITWNSKVPSDKAYTISLFVFFFFFPVTLSTLCYVLIHKEIGKMATDAAKRWGPLAQPTQETIQAKIKTVKMSFVMLVAFLVAWFPYAIVSLYSSLSSKSVAPVLGTLPALFAKTSTCCNPVIYFFMFKKFRVALTNMFPKNQIAPLQSSNN